MLFIILKKYTNCSYNVKYGTVGEMDKVEKRLQNQRLNFAYQKPYCLKVPLAPSAPVASGFSVVLMFLTFIHLILICCA